MLLQLCIYTFFVTQTVFSTHTVENSLRASYISLEEHQD